MSYCTGNEAKLAIVKTFLTGGIQPVVTVVISMLVWFGQNSECHLDNDQGRNNLINARHVGWNEKKNISVCFLANYVFVRQNLEQTVFKVRLLFLSMRGHAWNYMAGLLKRIMLFRKKSFCLFHTSTLHNQRMNDFAPVVERSTFNKRHDVVEVRLSYIWYFRKRDVRIGCLFRPQFSGNECKSDITFRLP